MRLDVLGLSMFLLCLAPSAIDGQLELKRLSDAHQMFLLRDALSKYPHRSDFYAGEVACAFNDTATCEDNFRKVLATKPK